MQTKNKILNGSLALLVGVSAIAAATAADAAPRKTFKRTSVSAATSRPVGVQKATSETTLSQGRGQLVNLPSAITDVFVANDGIADVQVRSPFQLYIFGKSKGETSVYATNKSGAVVYSTNVRVAQNISSLDQVMKASFPDSDITAYTIGQTIVLAGTAATPEDSLDAESIALRMMNPGIDTTDPKAILEIVVINRLKMATPLQVSLQVRIAEVSRSFTQNIGVNWQVDNNGPTGTGTQFFGQNINGVGKLNLGGRLLGLNILSQLDAGENEGFVTTLASPTLTAISGQTASFIAGGEIPIPGLSTTALGSQQASVAFRPYGVTLEFKPTVEADGRILLKVRPEVSDLDYTNAIDVLGSKIPGTTVRRVETTVELGSGQSFVIGGLMKSSNATNISKLPGVGNIPILGSLFRSNGFKRGETELLIVVTPYLVKPVSANQIVLPTDGYKNPTELGRIFNGELYKGAGEKRPTPTLGAPQTVVKPSVGASLSPKSSPAIAAPGFSN
jgi:pilus assembly protein CpaC